MKKRVLILSFADDFHALAIQTLLRNQHDADADIVDTSLYPAHLSLLQYAGRDSTVHLEGRSLREYHCIWNRRPKPPQLAAEIVDEERELGLRECLQALWGAIYASGLPLYNRPEYERVAGYKPYQLQLAQDLGLRVPDTLITTSPEEARAFAQRHAQVIYKGFNAATWMMIDTRPLGQEDVAQLWRLQYAPVIFQEFVPLGREYRVSLVGEDCFAAEVVLENEKAQFDWRLDDNHKLLPAQLPEELVGRLQRLRRTLQLSSGAVDLRQAPDGTFYFLEINPAGQFLFLDVFGGLDVGNAFCRMLLQ